ncbi:RFA2 [Candida oxycetoniae]|uniref:RFA2 n=1 Tax=Candida oxycetoniae TaxID=497107 RepID=A0AAI9WX04_9ASCO|nr:RFA2 [Candida oxycetoniae]KAI3403489.2 RFA2 [Candida oxycetoniae]
MSEYGTFGNYGGNYGDGGFANTGYQGGGFNNEGESQSTKQQVRSSLTPVTIKQILEASQPKPDGDFIVNNVTLNMVSFIGVVRKLDGQGMSIVIMVEDGTGSIEVRKWVDENNSSIEQEMEKYSGFLNKYVFIGGSLKTHMTKKSIQNAAISPIEDSNQIIYHHLSAIDHHLKSQGVPKSSGSNTSNSLFVKDDSSNSLVDKIFDFIREESKTMQEGVPLQFIAQKLGIEQDVALKECNELIENGRVYLGYNDGGYIAI